jgi:hypothetical protein
MSFDSAKRLCDRGFMEYIGVDVKEWDGKLPNSEYIYATGRRCEIQKNPHQLIPINDDVKIDSMIEHTIDEENFEPLFPGSTVYKNALGGTVIVFSGTPVTELNYIEGFSFLNWSRKQQFIKYLKAYGDYSAYCPGDEEMYFKSGKMSDGSSLCALFNIGLDPIDNIELVINRDFSKIQKLMPDGSRADVGYKTENDKTILDCPAHILDPVILIIS